MDVPRTASNGIEIEYGTVGSPGARPLLLIQGLGGQLIHWHEDLCELFVEAGHFVIRFDNRDAGLSTRLTGRPVNLAAALTAAVTGESAEVPYTMDDMADDAAAVLEAVGVDRAHVLGASMGGMIAQAFALRHPSRTRSLVSIMSAPELVPPEPDMVTMLATPAPTEREAYVEQSVADTRPLWGPRFPMDEEQVREMARRTFDRGIDPEGTARQLAAILSAPGRADALASVGVPTLVIHGDADRLVPPVGGRMTADAVPGSELLVLEGVGHALPREVWPAVVDAVSSLTRRADAERALRALPA
jgi:pimeloyl-ACP methyl ester carboxylesterase